MKAPFDIPASGAALQEFELQRVDFAAPEAGGQVGGVQAGFPLWLAVWSLGKMGAVKSDDWRSWLLEMRGATRRFIGRDLSRPYPKAHAAGFSRMTKADGLPFLGDASSWTQSIDGDGDSHVTLNGLAPGLVLSTGDYIGFRWSATSAEVAGLEWHAPIRVVRNGGGLADAAGSLTVRAEPPVPSAIPSGATAYLARPACVMVLLTDQTKLDAIDRRLAVRGGTIAAVQDLRS